MPATRASGPVSRAEEANARLPEQGTARRRREEAIEKPPAPAAEPVEVDLDWRSVAVFLAAFVTLVAFTSLVHRAGPVLTWVAVGTLLALALDPVVTALARRLRRRSIAVGVVLSGFIAIVVLLAAVFGPPAAKEAQNLSDDLPQVIHDLGDLPVIGHRLRDAHVDQKVQDFLDRLPERLNGDTTPLERAGRSVLSGALAAVATVLVAVALLLDGERLVSRIRRLVPPDRRPPGRPARLRGLAYRGGRSATSSRLGARGRDRRHPR